MVALNTLLHETTLAYQAHDARDERRKRLESAISAADAVQAALDETRHGTFNEWYQSDRVFGLKGLRAGLQKERDVRSKRRLRRERFSVFGFRFSARVSLTEN